MYVNKLETESLTDLIHGFRLGCFASSSNENIVGLYTRIERELVKEGRKSIKDMKEHGMTNEEIIHEIFEQEIEIWRRLEPELSRHSKSIH